MPRSEITTLETKIEVNYVTDIVITESVDDGAGGYVREIRIIGTQDVGSAPPRSLIVRVKGATQNAINVSTPQLNF